MAGKKKTKLVRLVSTGNTGYFISVKKSGGVDGKLAFKKYDPRLRKRVIFKEEKMK